VPFDQKTLVLTLEMLIFSLLFYELCSISMIIVPKFLFVHCEPGQTHFISGIAAIGSKDVAFELSSDPSVLKQADVVILAVPTPITSSKEPDLSFIEKAATMIGRNLKKGAIVVLESTVYPGVTEEVLGSVLEKTSGLVCGQDFTLGYSPERVNPGDPEHTIDKITKIVSGQDEQTTQVLAELYGHITKVYVAEDIRTAESAKVIENIQRDLNIALVNELALIFEKMGLSSRDVLDAAANHTPGGIVPDNVALATTDDGLPGRLTDVTVPPGAPRATGRVFAT